ncbi:phosphotransferase family protein [Paenibacillus spongiae]|uniref:Aminoglycoside phosphotransferase family protein n=1 Tax=Paenibacillus spongiae TaxID=2909671 RepID=A0ABY5S9M8_9BACL|nr:aminoglycoside phosphotransferase family protein [Paenibacillus spongiae]UVI30218.1 aminoglycoside phosphotransferase family protein [Paenibacillus spongiae]
MEDFTQTANRFLKDHFGERAHSLVLCGAGDWSKAYSFILDGKDMVIRFGAHREDFEKDRVMGLYSSHILPIPRVIEVGETESGGFYAVSERVPGKHLDELNGPEIQQVLPQLLDALHELQQLDLTDTQMIGLWRPAGTGPSWGQELLSIAEPRDRLAGWRERLDAFPQEARIFDAGVDKLRQLVPQIPENRGITHNDLLNRNVLVDGGRLTGVIDWGNAFYGDPLYDNAWFLYWWPWYPQWREIDVQEVLDRHWEKHGGWPAQYEERLRCCLIHIGLDHIAYSAFRQRDEDMKRNAQQLLTYI